MPETVEVRFGRVVKRYEVLSDPVPHIVVPTVKEVVHGWYFGYDDAGRRECTSERILLNPYNGCTVNCAFCYARGFGGYFDLWNRTGVVTVFDGFVEKLEEELDKLYVASCAYLSPVTEPFQPELERAYHLSERAAYAFLDRGLPVEFITKRGDAVPTRLLDRMAEHEHSFCQFTILTLDDEVTKAFSPGAARAEEQLKAVRRAADRGLFVVVRMDPLLPGITDDKRQIRELGARAKEEGARHFIFSVCDLSPPWLRRTLAVVRERFPEVLELWSKLYRGGSDADLSYRLEVFSVARRICDEEGVTMALCMEFEEVRGPRGVRYIGLNDRFMTSKSCEGINVPLYYRTKLSERFKPLEGCNGACLDCARGRQRPVCGISKLASASSLKLRDYLAMRIRRGPLLGEFA